MTSSNNVHVFLWTIPRSLSTAFTRSMESIRDVDIYMEPYNTAENYGPEGRLVPKDTQPSEMEYTFDKVKKMLEEETLNNKVVFVKDMASAVDKRYDKIANGFKHSFLIRHPAKAFLSHYNMRKSTGAYDDANVMSLLPEGLGYKELWELFNHVEKQEGRKPVVVNSDDLIKNPKSVLVKYCDAIGLEYNDGLLSWECKPKVKWNISQALLYDDQIYHFFSNSLTAGGFKKSLSKPPPAIEDLPEVVQECVQKSMPYYDKLNACCIRL